MFDYNLIHLNHRYFYLFGSIKLISNFFLFIRWSQFTFFFFAHFHFCSLAVEYKKLVLSLLKSNAYFPLHLCILYMFWVRTNLPSSFFFLHEPALESKWTFSSLHFVTGHWGPSFWRFQKMVRKGALPVVWVKMVEGKTCSSSLIRLPEDRKVSILFLLYLCIYMGLKAKVLFNTSEANSSQRFENID